MTIISVKYCYYPHFIDEETEAHNFDTYEAEDT